MKQKKRRQETMHDWLIWEEFYKAEQLWILQVCVVQWFID